MPKRYSGVHALDGNSEDRWVQLETWTHPVDFRQIDYNELKVDAYIPEVLKYWFCSYFSPPLQGIGLASPPLVNPEDELTREFGDFISEDEIKDAVGLILKDGNRWVDKEELTTSVGHLSSKFGSAEDNQQASPYDVLKQEAIRALEAYGQAFYELREIAIKEMIANPAQGNLLRGLVIEDDQRIKNAIIIITATIIADKPSQDVVKSAEREITFLKQAEVKLKEYMDIAGKSAFGAAGKAAGAGVATLIIGAVARVLHVGDALWPLLGRLLQHFI